MFSFCFFGFAVSVVFILLGLVLTTNKKIVIIDKVLKRIELEESCRFCYRVAAIHFDEIIKFELTKSPERLFSSHMGMWIIKAHVKRPGSSTLSVEKIYYSMSLQEAEDVAELLSASCHKETIINTGINGRRVALRIA